MSNRLRKFQNEIGAVGRNSYDLAPKRRQKVIWSRSYRQRRKVRNEMAFQSRKANRR